MKTVADALELVSKITTRGPTFVRADGSERHLPFADFVVEVRRAGAGLRSLGISPGDRVALVVPDPEAFVKTFLGALAVGIVPVPLYPPSSSTKLETYAATLAHVLSVAGAHVLIAPKAQLDLLGELIQATSPDVRRIEAESLPQAEPIEYEIKPEEIALLQFTSGSTAAPKGVTITHAQLAANAHAIMVDGLKSSGEDTGVSWLPLYHDMGLIGFVVAPLFTSVPVVFIPTSLFVRRPSVWLDAIHRHRGTITFAPNFAYALATRSIADRVLTGWDLSSVRVAGCGAEPIQPKVLRDVATLFSVVGFKPSALMPAFGMAEATLAITFAELTEEPKADRVDPQSLKLGKPTPSDAADAIEIACCGKALPRFAVEVRDEAGNALPERTIGELYVRGPSIASGYFRNDQATADTFKDGWLKTGDLGYLANGELYVSGRKKDLIIIRGRNYFPQDIEAAVGAVDGVRDAQCAAFSVRDPRGSGDEQLVVVTETARARDTHDALRTAISERVFEATGLVVAEVVFIRRGTLPKTSSGKVRRAETRSRYESQTLELAGRDSEAPSSSDAAQVSPSFS
ncbi:MAG: fatty acyl-AMP ligase [Polyangiaceae bacterium]